MKVRIINKEYVDFRISWSKKGGNRCHELGHGIHNTLHPVLVNAGVRTGETGVSRKPVASSTPPTQRRCTLGVSRVELHASRTSSEPSTLPMQHWYMLGMSRVELHASRPNSELSTFVFFLLIRTNHVFIVKNGHSIFDEATGLKRIFDNYRILFKRMVESILGWKVNFKLCFNIVDIEAIKAGIEANPKLKACTYLHSFPPELAAEELRVQPEVGGNAADIASLFWKIRFIKYICVGRIFFI